MDRTRVGAWVVLVLAAAQAVASALFVRPTELALVGAVFSLVAGLSAFWLLRRPDRNRWPLVAWTAGFFGWHVTGLLALAGLVTTGVDGLFLVGRSVELSLLYQVVLATAAGFAVHLLVPRPRRG